MTRPKVRAEPVPSPHDADAWAKFIGRLRRHRFRTDAAGLHVLTIRGWELARPTDRLIYLPGRELYLMTDQRWKAR